MPVTTSQQLSRYYEQFQHVDVTFTAEVIKVILLVPKQVYLRCLGYQWPCIIYASSLTEARVIVNLQKSLKETLKKANNLVSLRFCFAQRDKVDPVSFFVSAKVSGFTPYGKEKPDLFFLSLSYTQRPPDDLIEVLGQLLEAKANSHTRKNERIVVTADSAKKIGLKSKETQILIDGVPRRGIIRDLSFSGAKVIILGIAKFMVGKEAVLRIELVDPADVCEIPGKLLRFETVEGRSDIAAFVILFDEDKIPMKYKMRINNYLKLVKFKKPNPGGTNESTD
jgi:hypothetical protein